MSYDCAANTQEWRFIVYVVPVFNALAAIIAAAM
jgi:hypothetical protein